MLLLDPAVERAMREEFFATLIVIADVNNVDCLARLDDLRRRAARTWMIVVSPRCDTATRNLIFRHGGDACVAAPVSADKLIARLRAFRSRSRPSF